ncbi:hypothetical protein Q5L94_04690 [Idiomarina sp. Sol25]|uniref:hypothetical protein n=1 Tax=Idiomarina sp. Sol25 TaxID=3064000 RepID=UPI00294B9455|nr:hypothetical protein [Idiomarina sp. Sol25]MDV6327345.1 hypothetical protein [Idiomarina sp. Sol25]
MKPIFSMPLTITVSIFLVACGGGESDNNESSSGGGDAGSPTTYEVSTKFDSEHGSIDPASISVEGGRTADFEVLAKKGFDIDEVSGCGGDLVGTTYNTGVISQDCIIEATFIKPIAISIESFSGVETPEPQRDGSILIRVDEKSSGELIFDSRLSGYTIPAISSEFVTFSVAGNKLQFDTYDVDGPSAITFAVSAYKNGELLTQPITIKAMQTDELGVEGAFCFKGYCNGEEPKEIKHNLFEEDRTYIAHYVEIAPAQNPVEYMVSSDFGEVTEIEVNKDVSGDAFSYEYNMNAQEILIYNPYNYNDEPLINYTVTMTNSDGEQATETVSIMYFNAYSSGRFTNFNDTPVALPIQGSKTFKVELENYGAADSKEVYIRDIEMMIPSLLADVDENDSCELGTDDEGNSMSSPTLESCDLVSMSVDRETNEVTITTKLQSTIDEYRDQFSSGFQLYPYIFACVTTSKEDFNVEDCQDLNVAGMNAFISEYNAQEQAKIDELEQLMPKVRAFFEYDIAIKEFANLLNVQGYISNEKREQYIEEIRFLSAPIIQEYNIAMQYIFNINGNSVSGLENQENSIQTTIENIEYYLSVDELEEQKSALYNKIINESDVSDTYGLLDSSSPVVTGDDGQPTRFAYNESYGEVIDDKFVFSEKYRLLELAVKKSKY